MTCDKGTQTRNRTCTPPNETGMDCQPDDNGNMEMETLDCLLEVCPGKLGALESEIKVQCE